MITFKLQLLISWVSVLALMWREPDFFYFTQYTTFSKSLIEWSHEWSPGKLKQLSLCQ